MVMFAKMSPMELALDIQKAKQIEMSRSELGKATDVAKENMRRIDRLENCLYHYLRDGIEMKKRSAELLADNEKLQLENKNLREELATAADDRKTQEKLISELRGKADVEKKSTAVQFKNNSLQLSSDILPNGSLVDDKQISSSVVFTPRASIAAVTRTTSARQVTFISPMDASSPIEEQTMYISASEQPDTSLCSEIMTPVSRRKGRRSSSFGRVRGILKTVRRSLSHDSRAQLDTTLEVEAPSKKEKKKLFA